ncbi:hypothetical protein [Micromonospora sp. NPDC051296]|uniref:hypothetical protein n=1 Tax=Micromonospora sp. NPDC051296 TaxID=3155046 RepID=UPI003427D07A
MSDSHGHVWRTRSRHRTSEGTLHYQSCHCGRWRIRAGRTAGTLVETGPCDPGIAPVH